MTTLINSPGMFQGEVLTRWLPDGRSMQLLEDFAFIDSKGTIWNAWKAAIVDGASIPRFGWTLIGPPFVGFYREATVIHDVYCENQLRPAQEVHDVFLEMMLIKAGDDEDKIKKAKLMYSAVDKFGPRW